MTLPASIDVPNAAPRSSRVGIASAVAWGASVGIAMSTQLLFQPFIWHAYDADEIVDGLVSLAAQRLAVSVPIALAVVLATRVPIPVGWHHPLFWRAALLGAAILAGALAGEGLLLVASPHAGSPEAFAVLTRVVQWCLLASSVATLWYMWRRSSADAAAVQAAELHRIAAERQVVQTRLQALRSQIEPHFLFNTLATVRRLHRTEQDQGAQLLAHFLDYLRSALPERPGERQTLGREIDLVQGYLGVVAVRMAGRLTHDVVIPAALRQAEFPALSLATLVENAVKHGIGPSPGGGHIAVHARRDGPVLEVVVADTGVGFSTDAVGGSGIGLSNIGTRLSTLYGDRASLALAANQPTGVRATMRLPLDGPAAAAR